MRISFTRNRSPWVELLEAMYDEQIHSTDSELNNETSEGITAEILVGAIRLDAIKERTNMTAMEWDTSVKFLDGTGAIETTYKDGELVNIGLCQEGLELAHQIKSERQRRNTNYLLIGLTVILVILTLLLVV